MFKFHDIEQNTDEWMNMRCGKITSSKLGCIMANYGKAFGNPAKDYALTIAIERVTGKKIPSGFSNAHTERGHEQEPIARSLYEDRDWVTVDNGGFFSSDNIGCSPDGLVGNSGLVEIKSVISKVHYECVRKKHFDTKYRWQLYGNLKFTGREWIDFISYCSEFPEGQQLFIHRLYRDDLEEEFKKIDLRIEEFETTIKEVSDKITSSDYFID